MQATKEEARAFIKIAQEATKEAVYNTIIEMLKLAAPFYEGKDGEFALNNFADTLKVKINETSVQEEEKCTQTEN